MILIINLKLHSIFLLFMSNNFGIFLLFSILVTGLIVNPLAFAQETPVNATETTDMTESSNSTSTETTDMTESSNSTSTETTDMTESSNSTSTETTDMTESSNSTSTGDETMVVEDEMIPTVLSPLKQIKEGIVPENVVCKEGLGLVFKLDGQPACVKTTSIEKLIAWGWAR